MDDSCVSGPVPFGDEGVDSCVSGPVPFGDEGVDSCVSGPVPFGDEGVDGGEFDDYFLFYFGVGQFTEDTRLKHVDSCGELSNKIIVAFLIVIVKFLR